MKKQVVHSYIVIYERDEEYGCYTATVPALNGITTEGDTLEDAQYMAHDMIDGYLYVLKKNGLPIPEPDAMPVNINKNTLVAVINA